MNLHLLIVLNFLGKFWIILYGFSTLRDESGPLICCPQDRASNWVRIDCLATAPGSIAWRDCYTHCIMLHSCYNFIRMVKLDEIWFWKNHVNPIWDIPSFGSYHITAEQIGISNDPTTSADQICKWSCNGVLGADQWLYIHTLKSTHLISPGFCRSKMM